MPETSEVVSVYRVSERRQCHNHYLSAGRIPRYDEHRHKMHANNLGVCTLSICEYFIHKVELFMILHFSAYNFDYLSAENIYDPVSNQELQEQ